MSPSIKKKSKISNLENKTSYQLQHRYANTNIELYHTLPFVLLKTLFPFANQKNEL